jgi:hypothetical protein
MGMFDGIAAGQRSLAAGIQSIGQAAGDFAMKKQEAVNYATAVDADRKMKEAFVSFQDDLKNNGDETTWEAAWQKRAGEVEKEIGVEKMPGALRDRLSPQMESWKSSMTGQVRSQATARQINRAKGNVMESAENDLKLGDVASYTAKIQGGEQHGLFDPAEAKALVKNGVQKAEYYAATNMILTNPMASMDALTETNKAGGWVNYDNLDEKQRKTLIDSANVAVQRVRAETYQDLIGRMNDGQIIPVTELDGMVEKKMLTSTQARDIQRNQGKSASKATAGAFAGVMSAINAYDPRDDGTNENYANLAVQVATLPPGLKEDAYSRLKEKRDPASPLNGAVARDAMSQVDASFKAGLFGQFEVSEQDKNTGLFIKKTDPVAYAAALEQKVKIEDALSSFFRDKPKATRVEALAYVGHVQAGHVAKQGASLFVAPTVRALQTTPAPAEVDALLAKYGKQPKK